MSSGRIAAAKPQERTRKEIVMLKHLWAAAIACALVAIPAAPSFAQGTAKKTAAAEKKVSPQQQKMKDCAGKWGDYKKEKNVKGRAEHRKFMSSCLKG
jgi:hypothetical protein